MEQVLGGSVWKNRLRSEVGTTSVCLRGKKWQGGQCAWRRGSTHRGRQGPDGVGLFCHSKEFGFYFKNKKAFILRKKKRIETSGWFRAGYDLI